MAEQQYDFPPQFDSAPSRLLAKEKLQPAVERMHRWALENYWINKDLTFIDSPKVTKPNPDESELLEVARTLETTEGLNIWRTVITAYERSGIVVTNYTSQRTCVDVSPAGSRESEHFTVSKHYAARFNGKVVSLDLKGLTCVWTIGKGAHSEGVYYAIDKAPQNEYLARVSRIFLDHDSKQGEQSVFWYDGFNSVPGHREADIPKGFPGERVLTSLDFNSVNRLLPEMPPGGGLAIAKDRSTFHDRIIHLLQTPSL